MKIRKNFEEDDDYLDLLELAEQDEDFYEDYSTTSEDSFGNESIDKPGLDDSEDEDEESYHPVEALIK